MGEMRKEVLNFGGGDGEEAGLDFRVGRRGLMGVEGALMIFFFYFVICVLLLFLK